MGNKWRIWWLALLAALSFCAAPGCRKADLIEPQPSSRDSKTTLENPRLDAKHALVKPGAEISAVCFKQHRIVEDSLLVCLDADMSASSAQAGEAIRRGAALAIKEINAAGGVLGRPLELLIRDHRGNPDRGVDNLDEFAGMTDVIAVIGGFTRRLFFENWKRFIGIGWST